PLLVGAVLPRLRFAPGAHVLPPGGVLLAGALVELVAGDRRRGPLLRDERGHSRRFGLLRLLRRRLLLVRRRLLRRLLLGRRHGERAPLERGSSRPALDGVRRGKGEVDVVLGASAVRLLGRPGQLL